MEILVIGTEAQGEECRQKFTEGHRISRIAQMEKAHTNADVIFDFRAAENRATVAAYEGTTGFSVFFDTSAVRLLDLLKDSKGLEGRAFGFCGLRTFVNREVLEVVTRKDDDRSLLETVCSNLGTKYQVVADQAGMVTPRVICMIINEAYLTLEEGTATREDIDLAMKLGTNYPYGPFEWGERIGLSSVVRVLDAAGKETGDARYQVCKLLSREATKN